MSVDLGPDLQWVCDMEWPEGETQGGPMTLTIRPAIPGNFPAGGVSSTLLRDVDFKAALGILRRQRVRSKQFQKVTAAHEKRMNTLLAAHAADGAITDEYLALLSRVYVAAVSSGQEKPLDYLAELLNKTHAAIQNHLWQATRRGLLERSSGRAGGKLTAKAGKIIRSLTE